MSKQLEGIMALRQDQARNWYRPVWSDKEDLKKLIGVMLYDRDLEPLFKIESIRFDSDGEAQFRGYSNRRGWFCGDSVDWGEDNSHYDCWVRFKVYDGDWI